jgi:hypothetical protein
LAWWDTANHSVATVDTSSTATTGTVTGVAVGTTSVTASQGPRSGAANVNVTAAVVTAITVEGLITYDTCTPVWSATAFAHPMGGFTTRARAIGTLSGGAGTLDITETVTWSSSAPTRATISNVAGERGTIITGATGGTATITATLGTITDTLDLSVVNATLTVLQLNRGGADPVGIVLGNTSNLTLQGRFGLTDFYCITENATYTSGTPAVATVSNAAGTRGRVTSVATGSSVVTGTVGAISDTITVNVTAATLSWIEVLPATLPLARGSTGQLRAVGHYSDTSTNDITTNAGTAWTIENAAGGCTVSVDSGTNKGLVGAGSTACTSARVEACLTAICAQDGTDRRGTVTVL